MSHPLINIAVAAARKAGSMIVRAVDRLESVKISLKSENNFVTDIDKLAEKTIIDIIHKSYPEHNILGEESGEENNGHDYTWIIDPLDGTSNFIHGFPHFAVSIAVQYKDRIEHGVIYDPMRQELFSASRGHGAKLNQYRIRVSPCLRLKQALLATGFPDGKLENLNSYLKELSAFIQQSSSVRRTGSSALDLAYVAAGRLEGLWEYGLGKWDIAAGSLLIAEAGGLSAEPCGNKNYLETGNIAAASPALLSDMLEIIRQSAAL